MQNKATLYLKTSIISIVILSTFVPSVIAQEITINQEEIIDDRPSTVSDSVSSTIMFTPPIISQYLEDTEEDSIVSLSETSEIIEITDVIFSYSNDTAIISTKPLDIYKQPYSLWGNYPNYGAMLGNTGIFFGAAIGAAGLLYVLPESFSNWDRDEIKNDAFKNWWRNVKKGPVIDHDDWVLNYVAHPYVGSVYYMSARSAGFNAGYSLLYSFGMSTVFWEYGIEAFAEVPSLQDLIVTPLGGAIIGEGFYILKRKIVSNHYYLLNSKILGHTVAFLIDPVTELKGFFWKSPKDGIDSGLSFSSQPMVLPTGQIGYSVNLSLRF